MSNNNEFFINELAKELKICKKDMGKILNKVATIISKEKIVTKNLLARVIIHNLQKTRREEELILINKLLTSKFKHKCLHKHLHKFITLYKTGYRAKRIEIYFKDTLKCSISRSELNKILAFLDGKNG